MTKCCVCGKSEVWQDALCEECWLDWQRMLSVEEAGDDPPPDNDEGKE